MTSPSSTDPERLTVRIELAEHPSEEDLNRVISGVRHFNQAVVGHDPPRPIGCFLRDDADQVIGGVRGDLWGCSLHVAALWVADTHRGRGYGATLLREMEQYAASQGHGLAYVETLSFQARPFYERQGYRVFGELEAVAEGCTFYFLRKNLVADAPCA